jgi:hypothetical protein
VKTKHGESMCIRNNIKIITQVVLLLMASSLCFAKDVKNTNYIKAKRTEEVQKVTTKIKMAVMNKEVGTLMQFVGKDGIEEFD